MEKDYVACWLPISVTITDPAFICRWIRIHQIPGLYSRSAQSLRFQKSVASIIVTNVAPPDSVRAWVHTEGAGSSIAGPKFSRRPHRRFPRRLIGTPAALSRFDLSTV